MGWTKETSSEYKEENDNGVIILYKKLGEFNIN